MSYMNSFFTNLQQSNKTNDPCFNQQKATGEQNDQNTQFDEFKPMQNPIRQYAGNFARTTSAQPR